MSRFTIPIIFTAKPCSGFFACRVLLFEIQMWFAPCINREDKLLYIFINAIRYYNFFCYKRILILLVTVFNIDEFEHIFPTAYMSKSTGKLDLA